MPRLLTPEQKARKVEKLREWRAANPERARMQSTRANHKRAAQPGFAEANSTRVGEWQRANPAKVADRQRRRAAREAAAGAVSVQEWAERLAQYDGRCAYCFDVATERDHVVPLCKGGAHCISNIVPCCRSCNARKGTKLLVEWLAESI